MFASALAALLLASLVRSEPVPLEPSGTSVFNEGGNCTILWTPDTTGVWTTMNIELMTGDNFNQVHLKTVATVDGTDATNPSFSYPCLSVTPNARIYFYKFSSPATSDILFTTRFTIADASGNSVSATQSQTATNGDVVAYGTGALEDPSQGDEPPVVGTASASGATSSPSSTGSRSSSSSPTTRTSVSSTAVSTSQPNAGSLTSPLSALTLGAVGAFLGSLFV
ncbi:hypothetical protein FRC14_006070 [Serendipita sp. 396]|nr:hypothetical protein FRC14_006070 [Serendipita sp. 396]KAG8798676.1 hypothetical protein FRC16_006762 [Serendipita sp. 398]KAG8828654.1 hypothetical protein FRC19_000041 [Serendipita sp. 401]KAG8831407.1 hypothetical protein FRC18_006577 [Serendipita sp. 400]KAG9058897.1 hypothetical protein FS842_000095 [Serendipita sp. 407]